MSKYALVLERNTSEASLFSRLALARDVPRSGEYQELIRLHCHTRSTVAIVAVGSGQGAGDVCHNVAAELAMSGSRVVIVSVDALVRMNPPPTIEEFGCGPGRVPNVWLWPSSAGGQSEFSEWLGPDGTVGTWLEVLRRSFDSVLLDCPAVEMDPEAAPIAAMADAAILVVEAGRTTGQEIRQDQRTLQLSGAKLAGCILMRRR